MAEGTSNPVVVEAKHTGSIYTAYIITYRGISLEARDYLHKYNVAIILKDYSRLTENFQDYFLDWLHPTEEEFIAFCLEFDLEY